MDNKPSHFIRTAVGEISIPSLFQAQAAYCLYFNSIQILYSSQASEHLPWEILPRHHRLLLALLRIYKEKVAVCLSIMEEPYSYQGTQLAEQFEQYVNTLTELISQTNHHNDHLTLLPTFQSPSLLTRSSTTTSPTPASVIDKKQSRDKGNKKKKTVSSLSSVFLLIPSIIPRKKNTKKSRGSK